MNMPPSTMNLREMGGMMRVKRLNRFRLRVYGEQEDTLKNICYMSAVLWNKLTMFDAKCSSKSVLDGMLAWMSYTTISK